jgi:hypothetical protein
MRLERGQFGRPERLDFFKPVTNDCETLWPQPVQADARILFDPAVFDEAAVPQHTEVTAQTGRTHRERLGKVAGTLWFPPQQVDDTSSRRVSERQQGLIEVGRRH